MTPISSVAGRTSVVRLDQTVHPRRKGLHHACFAQTWLEDLLGLSAAASISSSYYYHTDRISGCRSQGDPKILEYLQYWWQRNFSWYYRCPVADRKAARLASHLEGQRHYHPGSRTTDARVALAHRRSVFGHPTPSVQARIQPRALPREHSDSDGVMRLKHAHHDTG